MGGITWASDLMELSGLLMLSRYLPGCWSSVQYPKFHASSPLTMRFRTVINLHSAVLLLAITTDKAKINDWPCDVLLSLPSLMPTFRAIFGNLIFIASAERHHQLVD
jgi:hypothetical protein